MVATEIEVRDDSKTYLSIYFRRYVAERFAGRQGCKPGRDDAYRLASTARFYYRDDCMP